MHLIPHHLCAISIQHYCVLNDNLTGRKITRWILISVKQINEQKYCYTYLSLKPQSYFLTSALGTSASLEPIKLENSACQLRRITAKSGHSHSALEDLLGISIYTIGRRNINSQNGRLL